MHKFVAATAIATIIGSAGCQSTRPAAVATEELPEPSCPAELQAAIKISASSVPVTIPPELSVDNGAGNGGLGRRLLVSVSPSGAARGMRILSSALSATTVGGTLKGWAAVERNAAGHASGEVSHAIDVSPGGLRLSPFLNGPTLQPQTVSLDLLVIPGGAPIDEMAISVPQMWSEERRPIPADAMKISLTPLRHFSMYDFVAAMISLDLIVAGPRPAMERWECSAETRVTLADRDAVTPPLWDLRKTAERGRSEFWLALFDQKTGPFRAIFSSPADATGFARWLRETHSTRVAQYQLGIFRPEYSDDARRTVPVGQSVIDSFQPASSDDVNNLVVGRLGEP
jgi:hypothetical protein